MPGRGQDGLTLALVSLQRSGMADCDRRAIRSPACATSAAGPAAPARSTSAICACPDCASSSSSAELSLAPATTWAPLATSPRAIASPIPLLGLSEESAAPRPSLPASSRRHRQGPRAGRGRLPQPLLHPLTTLSSSKSASKNAGDRLEPHVACAAQPPLRHSPGEW